MKHKTKHKYFIVNNKLLRIVLAGHWGLTNFGDDLILETWLRFLNKFSQEHDLYIEVYVLTLDNRNVLNFYKLKGSLGKNIYVKFIEYKFPFMSLTSIYQILLILLPVLARSNLVFLGGGGLINDYPRELMIHYLIIIALAKIMKCRVVLAGVGAEEFNSKILRAICNHLLRLADLIVVRDNHTLFQFYNLGLKNIEKICDISFLGERLWEEDIINTLSVQTNRKYIVLSLRAGEKYSEEYLRSFKELIRKIKSLLNCYLVYANIRNDLRSLYCKIYDIIDEVWTYNSRELPSEYALHLMRRNIKLILSNRLHFLIIGLLRKMPIIALPSRWKKVEVFSKEFRVPLLRIPNSLYTSDGELEFAHNEMTIGWRYNLALSLRTRLESTLKNIILDVLYSSVKYTGEVSTLLKASIGFLSLLLYLLAVHLSSVLKNSIYVIQLLVRFKLIEFGQNNV